MPVVHIVAIRLQGQGDQGRETPIMKRKMESVFDPKAFLAKADGGRSISKHRMNEVIFAQGDPADSVFPRPS